MADVPTNADRPGSEKPELQLLGHPDANLSAGGRIMSVLKVPRFLAFAISQAFSNFGDKLNYMALLAMIAALATQHDWNSSRANSFLLVVATLPAIVFGPLAGILIDRWNRRKVMLVCDTIRAILVFLVPFVAIRTQSLFAVFSLAFVVFLLGMFFNTARLAIVPNLIESANILEANSVLNLLGRIMTLLGLLLGGLIVDWAFWNRIGIAESWSAGFYMDSLTFVVSAVTLALIRIRSTSKIDEYPVTASGGDLLRKAGSRTRVILGLFREKVVRLGRDLKEAYELMQQSPTIKLVYYSVLLFVLLGTSVIVLLIPIIQTAKDDLGLGFGTKGVGILGAVGSIGLVLSSLVYGFVGRRIPKRLVLLGGFTILGLLAVLVAVSESLLLTLFLAFVTGLFLSPIYIVQDTLLHETVPEEARGRIFSAREWFMNVSAATSSVVLGQILLLFPKWKAVLFQLPFGIELDDRRVLLLAVGLLVTLLSLGGLIVTRKKKIG